MAAALPVISLALTAAGTGYGVYSGQRGAAAQKKGREAQKEAQDLAQAQAAQEQRAAEEAYRAKNQQNPNLDEILQKERDALNKGSSSTMLTGAQGVDQRKLRLSKSSLLGGM